MKKVVVNANYGSGRLSTEAVYLLLCTGFPVPKCPLAESYVGEYAFDEDGPDGFKFASEYPGVLLKDDWVYWGSLGTYGEGAELRSHPALIAVVEKLGPRVNADRGNLVIEEIPDDAKYRIQTYDGAESVKVYDPNDYVSGHVFETVEIPQLAQDTWGKFLAERDA